MKKFAILIAATGMTACTPGGIVKADEPALAVNPTQVKVSMADFEVLHGDEWTGNLGYLNYNSEDRSSIPVALKIDTSASHALKYSIKYPGEEQYNNTSKIKISKDGLKIDGKPIASREVLPSGVIEMMTMYRGKDDNKPADIQMTYTVSATEFRMKKDIRFDGQDAYFNRNEYVFTR